MEEVWRGVVGFEGLYRVSSLGRVFNEKRNRYCAIKKTPKGYMDVAMTKDGKTSHHRVHRLVAEAFIGKIREGYEIDHINCFRDDNRVDNLRIVTHKKNCNNPLTIEKKRERKGELSSSFGVRLSEETKKKISNSLRNSDKHPWRGKKFSESHRRKISESRRGQLLSEDTKLKKSKSITQYNIDGTFIRKWISATEVQRELGYSKSNICNCCRGKLSKAYGYIWRYCNE